MDSLQAVARTSAVLSLIQFVQPANADETEHSRSVSNRSGRHHRRPLQPSSGEPASPLQKSRLQPSSDEPAPALPESPSGWLAQGQSFARLGKRREAQYAYMRALELQPDSRQAARALLWFAVENVAPGGRNNDGDRRELWADLARFRPLAQHSLTLWRAYAAGYMVLNRPKEALYWFAHGWRTKPADRLWLADWASALQRTNQPTAARRLAHHAIALILPSAGKAAHREASPYEQEALRTLVLLLRTRRGPGDVLQRLRPALAQGLDPALTRRLKLLWQEPVDPEDSPALTGSAFKRGLLLRLRGEDATSAAGKASASAETKPEDHTRDADADADAEDDDSDDDDSDEDDDFADDETDSALAADGVPAELQDESANEPEDESELPDSLRPYAVTLGTEVRSLGDVHLVSANSWLDLSTRRLGLGLRASYTYVYAPADWEDGADLSGLRWGEVDLSGLAKWRLSKGTLELGVGGNLRAAQSLAYGWFHGDYVVFPGVLLELSVGLNQVVDDTSAVRLMGARDRLTGGVALDLTQREFINGWAGWQRYQSRQRELLSDGYSMYLEAGHRLLLANPGWSVRASAYWEQNRRVSDLPDGLQELLDDEYFDIRDFVVRRFAMVGAGTTLRRGVPGVAPADDRRLRLLFDLWLGYLWPQSDFGFDLQLGLGVSARRCGEWSINGFFSNSRHPGGDLGLSFGAGLRYVY